MDFPYRVVKELTAARYRAARYAVFRPIFGDDWMRDSPSKPLDSLRRMWHKRISSLKKVKWPRASTPSKVQYMRNCPPFGVHTLDSGFTCNLPFCPFCYARDRVIKPFGNMEHLFRKRNEYSVVAFKSVVLMKEACLIPHVVARYRKAEVNRWNPLGAYVLHQFSPVKMKKTHLYEFNRSGLMIFNIGEIDSVEITNVMRESTTAEVQQRKLETPTLTELAGLFGWAFRYHENLLTSDPIVLSEMFEELRSIRTAATYGMLYRMEKDSNEQEEN